MLHEFTSDSPGLPISLSHSHPALDDPALNVAKASWVVGDVPECFSMGMAVRNTFQGRVGGNSACIGIRPHWASLRRMTQLSRVGWKGTGFELVIKGSKSSNERTRVIVGAGRLEAP